LRSYLDGPGSESGSHGPAIKGERQRARRRGSLAALGAGALDRLWKAGIRPDHRGFGFSRTARRLSSSATFFWSRATSRIKSLM